MASFFAKTVLRKCEFRLLELSVSPAICEAAVKFALIRWSEHRPTNCNESRPHVTLGILSPLEYAPPGNGMPLGPKVKSSWKLPPDPGHGSQAPRISLIRSTRLLSFRLDRPNLRYGELIMSKPKLSKVPVHIRAIIALYLTRSKFKM